MVKKGHAIIEKQQHEGQRSVATTTPEKTEGTSKIVRCHVPKQDAQEDDAIKPLPNGGGTHRALP